MYNFTVIKYKTDIRFSIYMSKLCWILMHTQRFNVLHLWDSQFGIFSVVIQALVVGFGPFRLWGGLGIEARGPDRLCNWNPTLRHLWSLLPDSVSGEETLSAILSEELRARCCLHSRSLNLPWSCDSCLRIKGAEVVRLGGTVAMEGTWEVEAEITAEAGMCAMSWSMLGLVGSSGGKKAKNASQQESNPLAGLAGLTIAY